MSRHSFDPEIAGRVGLNVAVIFQNITFWIDKNQANRRNLREGLYWPYNSISAFGELLPHLSEKQIRTALENLVSAEQIIKGNFSDDRYDLTCWYALGNSCLKPLFDGVILSLEWKEAFWAKFVMGAPRPRPRSEQHYSDRRLRSQS